MASASEIILPIGAQKHDPAWKHCLMIRSGGRTMLKCMYCMKHFLGGGIHRIKEHLARQKGNASCCAKVPPEVQEAMLQSLEIAQARKKRRLKIAEEMKKLNTGVATPSELDGTMVMNNDMVDVGSAVLVQAEVREEGAGASTATAKGSKRGRKKKLKYALDVPLMPAASLDLVTVENPVVALTKPVAGMVAVDKDQVYMAIGKFLYDARLPLDAVNSVYFQSMLNAVATATGGTALGDFSYHEFRGQVLVRTLEEVRTHVEFLRMSWGETGCSVLADEWSTDKGKTFINFFVYCPKGTVFWKSVDATQIVNSPDTLYELLRHVVEEVGEKNVVHVITANSNIHALAGKRLSEAFPTLFWSPCAFQCIDLMLQDISRLETVSETLDNAKTITRFIYNNVFALNLLRKFTHGKELIVLAETRAALNFVTLKNMCSLKEELRNMVGSDEWLGSQLSKKTIGSTITNLIKSSPFWSSCALIAQMGDPLVHLLKLVCSNKRPAVGYIYAGLYQAKETIKRELVKKDEYLPFWEIIDWRWDKQLARPLHAAGFFLNPLFFEGIKGDMSNEIFSGMLDSVERMVPDLKKQDKIQEELNTYRSEAATNFRRPMAVRTRRTLLPANWWLTHGQVCPNLMHLAVRILSQTCSAGGFDRRHSGPVEQIHNQKLNFVEHQRIDDLTFVQHNLWLWQRKQMKAKAFDPISVDYIDMVDDWVVEKNAFLYGSVDQPKWRELNQPVNATTIFNLNDDNEIEAFIAGFDDEMIRGAARYTMDDDEPKEEDDNRDY